MNIIVMIKKNEHVCREYNCNDKKTNMFVMNIIVMIKKKRICLS